MPTRRAHCIRLALVAAAVVIAVVGTAGLRPSSLDHRSSGIAVLSVAATHGPQAVAERLPGSDTLATDLALPAGLAASLTLLAWLVLQLVDHGARRVAPGPGWRRRGPPAPSPA